MISHTHRPVPHSSLWTHMASSQHQHQQIALPAVERWPGDARRDDQAEVGHYIEHTLFCGIMYQICKLSIITVLILLTPIVESSDQVTIQYHLIISQPSLDSDYLAQFINSQNCLYNLNRKYELTNEEFEHINDSKVPKTKLQGQLLYAITSSPDKLAHCTKKVASSGSVMNIYENEETFNNHALRFNSRDNDVTLAKFIRKAGMKVIVALPRNLFEYYLMRKGVPGFIYPQYCPRSDSRCLARKRATQANHKPLYLDPQDLRQWIAFHSERQSAAMRSMQWLVEVQGVHVLHLPLEQLVDNPDAAASALSSFLGVGNLAAGQLFFHSQRRVRFDYSTVFSNWQEIAQLLSELAPGCKFGPVYGSVDGIPFGEGAIATDKLIPI